MRKTATHQDSVHDFAWRYDQLPSAEMKHTPWFEDSSRPYGLRSNLNVAVFRAEFVHVPSPGLNTTNESSGDRTERAA